MGHRIGTETRGRKTIHTLHDVIPIVSGAALISSTAARSSCRSTTARMRFMVLPSMRPGRFIEHRADSGSAFLVGRSQISRCSPKMLSNWPTDAFLQVRYALMGRRLTMTVTVSTRPRRNSPTDSAFSPITPATKIRTNPYSRFGPANSRSRLPGDQRSTTEFTEIHGRENPNQLPLSSFRVLPGGGPTPAGWGAPPVGWGRSVVTRL